MHDTIYVFLFITFDCIYHVYPLTNMFINHVYVLLTFPFANCCSSTHPSLFSYVSVEFAGLKEECANFRIRIQDIETEMKMYVFILSYPSCMDISVICD